MKNLFTGGRRKVAAVMAIALFTSLSPVSPIDAASKANNLVILIAEKTRLGVRKTHQVSTRLLRKMQLLKL